MKIQLIGSLFLAATNVSAWSTTKSSFASSRTTVEHSICRNKKTTLKMGRAAAVRAATKGKTDAKKAKINGLYGKKIIMAVKEGGSPDPVANRMLNDVIQAAKRNSVPAENIQRAIKKASEGNVGDFSETTFEAYANGGASLIINVLSDNSNRASAEVKNVINKKNAKLAESGSVLFMYDRKTVSEVNAVLDEEELLEAAIEAGVDDFELIEGDTEGTSKVYTDPKESSAMKEALEGMGHEPKIELVYVSKAPVECSEEDFEKNMVIIDALEDLDDVDSVEHNMSN